MSFKRLSEVSESEVSLLTARSRCVLLQNGELVIELEDDPEVLTSSKERRLHAETTDSVWIEKQLARYLETGETARIACADVALEVLTADTCVVLASEGKMYTVSFLRDIDPVGWLIPGGCPSFYQEIFEPVRIAKREMAEELIIMDKDGIAYSLGLSESAMINVLKKYQVSPRQVQSLKYSPCSPPQCLSTQVHLKRPGHNDVLIDNINATIDPMVGSVAITTYVEIDLPFPIKQLRLFDGEILPDGQILNRAVRLRNMRQDSLVETTIAYFVSGNNLMTQGWINECMANRAKHPSVFEELQT